MSPMDSDHLKSPRVLRNIVFFGETGTGKSSVINLLLKTGTPRLAPISNDSHPCTQISACYETTFHGGKYNLWDTRGLGGARNFIQVLFGGNPEKDLKRFLKERHYRREIDLLVCCIRGSRATEASRDYYQKFCVITRRLAAPVAVVVTHLEREKDMEDWWSTHSSQLKELGMEFDDHACITARQEHPRLDESKTKLIEMITRNRRWKPVDNTGSYFGSPVRKLEPVVPEPRPSRGGIWGRFWGTTGKANVDRGNLVRRPSNHPLSATPSIIGSSHLMADSPGNSTVPSPIFGHPTPRSSATSITVPPINTNILGADDRPQPPSEETSSAGDSLQSMLHPKSSHSSCTAYSDMYLEFCTEESADPLSELPFKPSAATISRKQRWALYSGAFGDVWQCDLISGDSSRLVAVKAVKIGTNNDYGLSAYEKKLHRELRIWGRLRHKNIAPLLGVVYGFGPLLSTVSPWFSNGSLSWYLVHCQVPKYTKHRLLGDIAVGLCYLHSQGVVHGDLHSGNVLIDDDGTACITDFGLSFTNDFLDTSYLKSAICGGVEFADPALVRRAYTLQDDVSYPTKPCDIYSFGGLVLHVLSGKKPYDGIPPPTLITTVMDGKRPQVPTHDKHITPWHRSLIRTCWDTEEHNRPTADVLVEKFDRLDDRIQ